MGTAPSSPLGVITFGTLMGLAADPLWMPQSAAELEDAGLLIPDIGKAEEGLRLAGLAA